MLKKRYLLLVLLILLPGVIGAEEGFGEEETPQTEAEIQNDKLKTEIAKTPGTQKVEHPVEIQETPVGEINAPAGTTVTTTSTGVELSQVSQATTNSDITIGNANDVKLEKNGDVEAESVNNFNQNEDILGEQLKKFKFDAETNTISVLEGTNIHFKKPYPITFKKVGPSSFEVSEDGYLHSWAVTYPEDDYFYTWKNPLTTNTKNKDTGILIGSATLAIKDPDTIVDGFMQARGNENDIWKGDNENYTGNEEGSSITFDIEKNSSFTIGSVEGSVFEATVLDDVLVSAITIKKTDNSYLMSSFNIVAYYYGEEFIERLRALTLSFRLDVIEGVYSHLLLSKGDYKFTFRNLKKYKDLFAIKANKHWAQSFQINNNDELYDLAIDKIKRRSHLNEYNNLYTGNQQSGYISLYNEKKLILNGLFTYLRKGFSIGGYEISTGKDTFYDFIDPETKFYPIIESFDTQNKLELNFEEDNNVFVNANIIVDKTQDKILFEAHFEDGKVYEVKDKQFFAWESKNPAVLVSLKSSHPELYIDKEEIKGKRILKTNDVSFISEKDQSVELFLSDMYTYDNTFEYCSEEVTPAYFTDTKKYDLVDWIIE